MILDIGCGSGHYQEVSKTRGHINFDILRPVNKIENFVLGDVHYLCFREGIFDKVFLVDVIEHLDNPVKALREIKRVLGKGVLILGTPNALYFPKVVMSCLKGRYFPYPEHILTYGLPELENLFRRVGFEKFRVSFMTYHTDHAWVFDFVLKFVPVSLRHRQLLAVVRFENVEG